MTFETGLDEIGLQMKQAANSRLRRDDVGGASDRKDEAGNEIIATSTTDRFVRKSAGYSSPTDQALIEGLARAIAAILLRRYDSNYDASSLAVDSFVDEARDIAQAALLYMQQHVRPFVEALGIAEARIQLLNAKLPSYEHPESWHFIDKALASLPPVLRGASMTSPDSEPMENV